MSHASMQDSFTLDSLTPLLSICRAGWVIENHRLRRLILAIRGWNHEATEGAQQCSLHEVAITCAPAILPKSLQAFGYASERVFVTTTRIEAVCHRCCDSIR